MARKVVPLTDTQIKASKPREKDYELSDGEGLILRVRTTGSKVWVLKYYKPYTKVRTNIGLGGYPTTSLKDARKLRDTYRSLLAQNIDPKLQKQTEHEQQAQAKADTFKAVALEWLEVKRSKVSEDQAKDILRSLELHLFKQIGNIPLLELTAPKVITALKPLEKKGSLETVKRMCQRVNEVMGYAVNYGKIQYNPLINIKDVFKAPPIKHQPTITPDRLPEFLQKLNRANIKQTTRCLIEFQLHTMARPSEAAGAQWSEINLEKMLWTIPPERMKKSKQHIVPLSSQVIQLLQYIRDISGDCDFIFPSDRDNSKHTNPSTANMAIKRMGFHGELVAHGLRSIASTTLNEEGFEHDLIEVALSHIDKNNVRKAYNHAQYIDRRREMMQWWSDHIESSSIGPQTIALSN